MKKSIPALENLAGVRRYAAVFMLGALMTLTLPPLGIFPLLLICVPGFMILSRNCRNKTQSFLTGWAFGAGYFIFGLYWISSALFVDIDQWAWVLPLSAILGPATLALFYGLIPLLAHRYRKDEISYMLAIIAIWAAVEWLRGHILTGFPWNLPGYSWDHALPIVQVSAYVGIYGLTLLTLFWAAMPIFAKNKKLVVFAAASFAFCLALGSIRLWQHPTEQADHHTVRIVQANIPQTMKWDPDQDVRNLEQHIALSSPKTALKDPVTFVIWPETSVLADLDLFSETALYISLKIPRGSIGILGTLRVTEDNRFFNSVTAIGKKGKVLGVYDKHHLVPFGEYIPFRDKLNVTPIGLAIANIGDFTRGEGVKTIKTDGLPAFSPLVCYEAIFPGAVADRSQRPDWLVNVTNDGWYGKTAGPHQHLATVRMRSIEEGLPLARAANTGISAMIDPLGRILASQPLGTAGAIDVILPRPLPPTLYVRVGDNIFFAALVFALAALERRKFKK